MMLSSGRLWYLTAMRWFVLAFGLASLVAPRWALAQPQPAPVQPPAPPVAPPPTVAPTAPPAAPTSGEESATVAEPTDAAEPTAAAEGRVDKRDYVPLGIAGLVTFGATWVATVVVMAVTDTPDKGKAIGHGVVPIAGPFIAISERSHAADIEGLMVGLGVLQGLGAGAALLGFTLESKLEVGDQGAFIAPTVGPTFGAHGAF